MEVSVAINRDVILQQLVGRQVHMAGIQEARPYSTDTVTVGQHIAVVSKASRRGGHGFMLAISTTLSWGTVDGRRHGVLAKDLKALQATPRTVYVAIKTQFLECLASRDRIHLTRLPSVFGHVNGRHCRGWPVKHLVWC